MSRTRHHKDQRSVHEGHDYSKRYECNRGYVLYYGSFGRHLAAIERRNDSKRICRQEIVEWQNSPSKSEAAIMELWDEIYLVSHWSEDMIACNTQQ